MLFCPSTSRWCCAPGDKGTMQEAARRHQGAHGASALYKMLSCNYLFIGLLQPQRHSRPSQRRSHMVCVQPMPTTTNRHSGRTKWCVASVFSATPSCPNRWASRRMALLAFLQTLDSNMAVGNQPEEVLQPHGSSLEATNILKRQAAAWLPRYTVFNSNSCQWMSEPEITDFTDTARNSTRRVYSRGETHTQKKLPVVVHCLRQGYCKDLSSSTVEEWTEKLVWTWWCYQDWWIINWKSPVSQ